MRYPFIGGTPLTPAPAPLPTPVATGPAPSASASVVVKTGTHTKRQCPIWIAQLTARVERKEFNRLATLANTMDGYWSSFGPVEQHGFIFFTEAAARAFQTLVGTSAPPAATVPMATTPTNIIPLPSASGPSPVAPPMPEWRARLLRRPLSV